MGRVAAVGAAGALACALVACGESRPFAAPAQGETGCAGCHSGPGEAPPFRDLTGSTDPGRVSVGAHDAHLHGDIAASVQCAECHTVPQTIGDPGHLEESPDDVRFGPLARTGGASPTYVEQGCAASYCHGNFPGGNAGNTPRWVGDTSQRTCLVCHASPPPTGRHADHVGEEFEGTPITCVTCHGPIGPPTHVDGVKTVALPVWDPGTRTCAQACHAGRGWGQ